MDLVIHYLTLLADSKTRKATYVGIISDPYHPAATDPHPQNPHPYPPLTTSLKGSNKHHLCHSYKFGLDLCLRFVEPSQYVNARRRDRTLNQMDSQI